MQMAGMRTGLGSSAVAVLALWLFTPAVLIPQQALAICYCPLSCTNKDCSEWERVPCADSELHGQCQHAEMEIEDYVTGRYSKRDKILTSLLTSIRQQTQP
jgi:hypothetical protein